MGVKLEMVPVTSANRFPICRQQGSIWSFQPWQNPDREKVIDFSIAYAPFYNGVFAPADAAIKSAADLAAKTVGVTRGAVLRIWN